MLNMHSQKYKESKTMRVPPPHPYQEAPYNISHIERLIVALDFPETNQAKALVNNLGSRVTFYKIGYELFYTKQGIQLLETLKASGKRVFLDLKLHDVPRTVGAAIKALSVYEPDFITIHAEQNLMREAVDVLSSLPDASKCTQLLGVTVLTSISQDDLQAEGTTATIQDIVLMRALLAQKIGLAGVVASPHEVAALRTRLKATTRLVIPGIRLENATDSTSNNVIYNDDQKRTLGPASVIAAGADYLVVGRPITQAKDPVYIVEKIQEIIKKSLQ